MTLIFSTVYDLDVFKNGYYFNTKYVGTLGLLTILERELGLYDFYTVEKERVQVYKEYLEKHKSGKFFEKSLRDGNFNVAEKLLSYRDELVLIGWNPYLENQSKRLDDLKEVELEFKKSKEHIGISDRWQRVIHEISLGEKPKQFGISEIIIEDSIELLPPHLKLLFKQLSRHIKCTETNLVFNSVSLSNLSFLKSALYNSIVKNNLETDSVDFKNWRDDNSVLILNFKNEQLLLDAMAYRADINDSLFVIRDNAALDFSLVSMGKPASGSKQINANPQVTQLLKLVIPCFSNVINLQTLISFLDLPYSPLNHKLRKQIARLLSRIPGFKNDEWNIMVECFTGSILERKVEFDRQENFFLELFNTKDAPYDELKKRKEQVELFLTFESLDEKDSLRKAKKIFKFIELWSMGMYNVQVNDESKEQFKYLKEQFKYLIELCRSLLKYDFEGGNVKSLEDTIKNYFESRSFANYFRQVNSIDTVNSISQIVTKTDKMVFWLDFKNERANIVGEFLLEDEIKFLGNNFYSPDSQVRLQLMHWLRGLLNLEGKLVLCTYENSENERHPFHLRIDTLFKKSISNVIRNISSPEDFNEIFPVSQKDLKLSEHIKLPMPKDYFNLKVLKDIKKREVESASSIENFIMYPFDWVMEKMAKFNNDVGFKLPEDELIKGNVAHRVIENLFTEFPNLDFGIERVESELVKVLKEMGVSFLHPDKRFDLNEFKYQFIKSLKTLTELINLNGFEVVACEYEFGKEKDCIIDEILGKATGYIDLYLIDKNKIPFIIDLKWTYSDKKYKDKIKQNEAIQLAIYMAAINNGNHSNAAYFMLNQNILITSAKNLKGNNIFYFDDESVNQELLNKIKESLEFRWSELKQGKLEVGDNFSLEHLQFHNEAIITLPKDTKTGKLKKEFPYSGYKLFKGSLK